MTDTDSKLTADALLNDLDLGAGKKKEKASLPGYARSVPRRTYILTGAAFGILIVNIMAAHAIFFATKNANRSILFWVNMLASTTATLFMIAAAGALFTWLAHVHAKETLARTIATQRALQRDGRR